MPSKNTVLTIVAITATLTAAVINALLARNQSLASSHILFFFLFLTGCITTLLGLLTLLYRVRFSSTPRVPTRARLERLVDQGLGQFIILGCTLILSGLVALAASLVSLTIRPSPENGPILQTALVPVAPTAPPESPAPSEPISRNDLRVTINNKFYTITPVPVDEMIKGLRGGYYLVDLKSADKQQIWKFKLGEYIVPAFDRLFAQSIAAFRSAIIGRLPEGTTYELFVRGSADRDLKNDFKGDLVEPYLYTEVPYLPRISAEQYIFASQARTISFPFLNKDLPFLRAAFMKSKLSTGESALRVPFILEGSIDEIQEDEELRNATVFLFINWPQVGNLSDQQVSRP